MYAQPVLLLPVRTTSTVLTTLQPTFKWNKVASATAYEFFLTSTLTDTSTTTIPVAAQVNTYKRYVSLTDTTRTVVDTVLAKNTIYYWKVRAYVNYSWGAWSKFFLFKVGTPGYSIANANARITFNHDTLGGITRLNFLKGSAKQLLDTVFNTTNLLGLGANGALTAKDTLISWASDTSSFTYRSTAKYGKTGSKVLTLAHDATGITATIVLTLEKTKTVSMATAWKPGGDAVTGIDNVLLVKTSAAKTTLTYPTTVAIFGPDSIKLSAMYDSRYDEYFGYKSDSLIAVTHSQKTGSATAFALEQKLTFLNSTDSNKIFTFYFAVRKTRTAYFDTWANNRPIAITKPTTGDSLLSNAKYVVWESFGATPASLAFSDNGGTTYNNATTVSGVNGTDIDSALYYIPGGPVRTTCVLKLTSSKADVALSGVFKLVKGYATFSMPTVFGSPGSSVYVPISVTDYVAGDSIKAFDIKMTFDSTFVKFDSVKYNTSLDNWVKGMDSTNTKTDSTNYVRVSAFKNTTGVGVKSSELLRLHFTVKTTSSNIGKTSRLKINNAVLSAAGNGAYSINVKDSSQDGAFKVYTSISGYIHYFHKKGATRYTISGDSLMSYNDATVPANNTRDSVKAGYFNLVSREPNNYIELYPTASKYLGKDTAITVADAQLAFGAWKDTLITIRQLITADVNEDSSINTTDAMAIMEISIDSTYLRGINKSIWIFTDSTTLAAFESRTDSLTAWHKNHKHSILFSPLVAQQTHQDFFGVLRGDVNFSAFTAAATGLKKTNATPVLFTTNASLSVRPGDTVWIPLNIYPNENIIGGFNALMQVDPKILTYAGQFKMGQSIPQDKNWYIAAKSDANGALRVAATDFSSDISPITEDGAALMFKYIVSSNIKLGTSSQIDIKGQSVIDKNLQSMASTVKSGQVEVSRMGSEIATIYGLEQNYPNPFNPSTTIEFALPKDSRVEIKIFNILGQQMASLYSGVQTAGYHHVVWDASNYVSGVYFYVMNASSNSDGEKFQSVKKLMILK
jgi:hypothetical protein